MGRNTVVRPNRPRAEFADLKKLPFRALLLVAALTMGFCSRPARNASRELKPKLLDVRLVYFNSPRNLIPYLGNIYIEVQLTDLIFNNLVRANYAGVLAPELAESWEISQDRKTYTFHLRSNVFFHNGKPLTVDDVIFTLERLILDSRSLHRAVNTIAGSSDFLSGRAMKVSGLKKIGPHVLKIELAQSFNYFLEFLSGEYAAILPDNFAGKTPDAFNENPIGTGPYRLSERTLKTVKDTRFSVFHFLKNQNYFEPTGNVDHIDFYFFDGDISAEAKLYFDIVFISNKDIQAISASPGYNIINTSYNALFFLILNPQENSDLKQQKVRQLIQYGVNREKLVSTIFNRQAIPAHSLIPFGLLGQNPGYRLDSQKAARLRSELGDKPVSFTLVSAARLQNDRVLDYLQNDLKRFSVNLTVETVSDPVQFFNQTIHQTKSSLLVGGIPDYPASYNFLSNLVETNGLFNIFHRLFPESTAGVRQLPSLDIVGETRDLERINRQLEEDAIYIPLYYYSDLIAVNTFIKKISFKYGEIIDFSRMEVIDE
jgi:ABC-type transport system substrate-binding protein